MIQRSKWENFKRRTAITLVTLVAGATVIGVAGCPHFDRDTYRATVTDKERLPAKNGENSGKYLVFTRLDDGKVRVFENTDSWVEFKFNSSTVQGSLERGETYDIETYGFRIPWLSKYENITRVIPVTNAPQLQAQYSGNQTQEN